MARKDDRRIQRTRKALRDALHSLVLDRGYDDLSVQDITDKANLGRATFYLHYREKDELLEDLLREFSESFAQRYGSKVNYADRKVVQAMFEYAENHYDFYRIMTIGKGGLAGIRKLRAILQESYSQFLDGIEAEAGGKFGVPRDFLDSYQANAIMNTIFLWLEQDMPYPPAEMADMYLKLASPARLPFSVSSDEPVIDKQKAKNNKASKQAVATEQTLAEVYPQAEKENTNGFVDAEDKKE